MTIPQLCSVTKTYAVMTSGAEFPSYSSEDNKGQGHLGAAARRALVPLMMRTHHGPNKLFFEKILKKSLVKRVLHLDCGRGEDALLMASLMEAESLVYAVDRDGVLISNAQHIVSEASWPKIQFKQVNDFYFFPKQKYDLVFMSMWKHDLSAQKELIPHICLNMLEYGGLLALNIFNIADYKAYPYNHAFARSTGLLGLLADHENDLLEPIEALEKLIENLGCSKMEVYETAPSFIPADLKSIVSLFMEYMGEELVDASLTSREEIHALILELRRFEQKADTLISRSGLLQVCLKI